MRKLNKQQITEKLAIYIERYDSQNKAAKSLHGVSSATISQMLNGNWELINEEMWRNVAAQIGYTDDDWVLAETRDFKLLNKLFAYAKKSASVLFIVGDEGTGKTETIKKFAEENKRVYALRCNDFWNRKTFLGELMMSMGCDASGYTMYEMMGEVIRNIKKQEDPIIIFDEADKMNDQLLYFFITLFNNLEDHCSIVLIATHFLKKRLLRGIHSGKKGYPEIYSRGGKKFIELQGVGSTDVRAICMANGITDATVIKEIYTDCSDDLRRVKTKIRAYKASGNAANAE